MNPNGLHLRYVIRKSNGQPIDPKAEYFVLRLDNAGTDPVHVAACRKAVLVYAEAIKAHLPLLAKDIFERYEETGFEQNEQGRC